MAEIKRWTPDEDTIMQEALRSDSPNWEELEKKLVGRTPQAINFRYYWLKKGGYKKKPTTAKKDKSKPVDRTKIKPQLTVSQQLAKYVLEGEIGNVTEIVINTNLNTMLLKF